MKVVFFWNTIFYILQNNSYFLIMGFYSVLTWGPRDFSKVKANENNEIEQRNSYYS